MNVEQAKLPRFLVIHTENAEHFRQGRLLQVLVIITAVVSLVQAGALLVNILRTEFNGSDLVIVVSQVVVVLLFTYFTLRLIYQGRILPALHLFFIALNIIFLSLLFSTDQVLVFPYLLLVSVFAVAAMHSIGISAIYLGVIIVAIMAYYQTSHPDGYLGASHYIWIAFILVATSWLFARDLRVSRDKSSGLAEELEGSVEALSHRAEQLQFISEVGRTAVASLDPEKLLHNTTSLIQERFGFYFVGILLLNQEGSHIVLQEGTGETGQSLKESGYTLPVGPDSIVGWVTANRQARIALDVGEDPHYFIEPHLPDTRSEVALPLIARGRLLGVLDVQSQQANAFQEEDVSTLQVMADQIAGALDNARLFEETRGQANLLAELQNVTSLMNQQANTRNALNVLAQRAMNLLDTDGGGVWLWDSEDKTLELTVSFNIGENTTGQQLSPGEGLSGRSFSQNKTLVVDDYATWSGQTGAFAQIGFHAALAVPLRRQNEAVGVLALTRSQPDRPFKPDQVQIAELLAAQVGAVIVNNQLIEETRRLVQRERAINQASAQIRRSLDAKTILDTTTGELGEIFGNKLVRARLFPQEDSGGEAATREEVGTT